jgi:ADP-dependent phosphofructokinase/glucokinase
MNAQIQEAPKTDIVEFDEFAAKLIEAIRDGKIAHVTLNY